MSRIDQLIAEHCPDGVPYLPMGEVGEFVRGSGLQKADFVESGIPCIHYGQIYTFYGICANETKSFVSPDLASRLKKAPPQSLLMTTTSENIQDVGKSVAWLGETEVVFGGHACAFIHTLDPMYATFIVQSRDFQTQKDRFVKGTKVKDISTKELAKINIPVPPIEIQREISQILHDMNSLQAELQAELAARRSQYDRIQSALLMFGDDVPRVKLGDIAEYTNGKAHERLVSDSGTIPLVTARFISRNGEANRFVSPDDVVTPAAIGDVALVLSDLPNGRALARAFYIDRDGGYAINQRIARIRVSDSSLVEPRFLFHVLNRNSGLLRYDNGTNQTHLSKEQVTHLRIPLPTLSEQLRITRCLDTFDALVSDISIGLPAEIKARRTQYEYYRDQLLSFKELAA